MADAVNCAPQVKPNSSTRSNVFNRNSAKVCGLHLFSWELPISSVSYFKGTYMEGFCSQKVCLPCKKGFFSHKYNLFDTCEECRSCQQGKTLIYGEFLKGKMIFLLSVCT